MESRERAVRCNTHLRGSARGLGCKRKKMVLARHKCVRAHPHVPVGRSVRQPTFRACGCLPNSQLGCLHSAHMKNPHKNPNTLYRCDLLSLLRTPHELGAFAYRDVLLTRAVVENMASAAHQYKGLHNHARLSLLDRVKHQKASGTAMST